MIGDAQDPRAPLPADALATLCEVSMAMLGVAGFDGRVRWVNPAFVTAFGYSREELLVMPSYVHMVHPDDRDTVTDLLGSLSRIGTGPSVDVRMRHRDGSWRWCRSSTVVVDDLVYFSAVDLTDDYRRSEDLARANASLRLFGVGVAHDLRSLLTVIEGAAAQLAALIPEDPERRDAQELTAMLTRSVGRAWIFVGALLAVTRGEPVDREVVGLDAIVAGAAEAVVAERATSGASIQWDPDLPAVWVNPVLITATLANLFANAIRYHASGASPEIVVDASRSGDVVTVSVTDNGAGIAMADLAAVFEPFERRDAGSDPTITGDAERGRVQSGYGLGLALCRQVVEAHGGRVWATSEAGLGTTMMIELPATPP